jgi:hypothetical protein
MNTIKKQIAAVLWTGLLTLTVQSVAAPLDFTEAIHYTSPTNFYRYTLDEGLRSDPGDNPFSMNGQTFLQYKDKNDQCDLVIFQFGLVGAYIGEGKVVKFLPVTPTSLKTEIESEYNGKFSNSTVAAGEICGLTSVSLTAIRNPDAIRPYFLHFCWIQIETNTVLKISAYSCNAESFKAVTNSLQSLKIDKPKLLELFHSKIANEKP